MTRHTSPGADPYCPGQGNTGYQVIRYELDLAYLVTSGRLSGTAMIFLNPTEKTSELVLDMAGHLKVGKVSVDGSQPAKHRQRDGKLVLSLKRAVSPDELVQVVISYSGSPKPLRTVWGEIGFEELADGALVASQPNGAHSWFPCDDRPTSKAGYRFEVAVPAGYRAVCNGTLVDRRVKSSQVVWVYEQPEPMAAYLATLQIGRYDRMLLGEEPAPSWITAPPDLLRRITPAFGRHPQMMQVFDTLFGPYPFAEHTVVVTADELEIPVEAQGLSIFGSNFVTKGRDAERLVAHELAHQWFGNSVTCERWRDIWLHEGFACYAEWLWSEHSGGPAAAHWAAKHHKRLAGLPQDLVLAHPGPKDMFDDRVYKRGALTLHTLRITTGDETFFHILRTFAARYRYANASTEDFLALAAEAAGEDLGPLFKAWLYEKKLPALPVG